MIGFDCQCLFQNVALENKNEAVHTPLKQKKELEERLYLKLIPNSELYVVTNPLVGEKKECEIEDLFSPELLNIVLDGKTFCRKGKFDNTKYFGKEIFSQYVSNNYEKIDFTKFIPLLDAIDSIVVQGSR